MLQGGKITRVSVHSHFRTCTAYIFGRKRSAHCAQLPFCTSGPKAGVFFCQARVLPRQSLQEVTTSWLWICWTINHAVPALVQIAKVQHTDFVLCNSLHKDHLIYLMFQQTVLDVCTSIRKCLEKYWSAFYVWIQMHDGLIYAIFHSLRLLLFMPVNNRQRNWM